MESPSPGSSLPTSDLKLAPLRNAHNFPQLDLRGNMLAAQRNVLRGPEQTSSRWWGLTSLPRRWVTRRPACVVTTFRQDTLLCRACCQHGFEKAVMNSPWVRQLCGQIWFPPLNSHWKLYWGRPAMWANFERFLTYPFHSASISGSQQSRGQRIGKKERLGARGSRGFSIYFLFPLLDLKRLLGIKRNVVCHCSEPLNCAERCAKKQLESCGLEHFSLCPRKMRPGGEWVECGHQCGCTL